MITVKELKTVEEMEQVQALEKQGQKQQKQKYSCRGHRNNGEVFSALKKPE